MQRAHEGYILCKQAGRWLVAGGSNRRVSALAELDD